MNLYRESIRQRNKARLNDGRVVEYDQCCEINSAPVQIGGKDPIFIGTGVIVEVNGVPLKVYDYTDSHKFWLNP